MKVGRWWGIAIATLLALGGVTPGARDTVVMAQEREDDAKATIAALQTEVAELRAPEEDGVKTPTPGTEVRPPNPDEARLDREPTGEGGEGESTRSVNIELILDVSGSMAQALDTGETRMDAAQRVLAEVLVAIPDGEGINVGLRIYGHQGDNTEEGREESCRSSEMVVPVDRVDKEALRDEIGALEPTGWTPIALSLERAAEDFLDADDGTANAVVLVTDGLETCGGDPAGAAGELRAGDGEVATHVIGFALTPEEQALLEGIAEAGGGLLLGATDATELTAALFEVLEELEVVRGVGFIGGNALGLLPEGEPGELSVLAVGPYDGNVLPLVVRNNTDEDVIRIEAAAIARNPAGQLIASGGDQLFGPNLVRPGGIAIGYAYFGGIDLPPDAEFEVELDATPATDDEFENIRDLEVIEASTTEGRVIGVLRNGYDEPIGGPIGANLVCFDADGDLLIHARDYLDEDEVDPGEDATFQVSPFGVDACPIFLVAGSGFDKTLGSGRASEILTPEATEGTGGRETDERATATLEREARRANELACPELASAEAIVLALQARGLPIGDVEVYDEETDPNELLGRPGGYEAKANFADSTLEPEGAPVGVENGGSVEIYMDEASAERRQAYLEVLGEEIPLIVEYDQRVDSILLRLSNRLTPDEAAVYGDTLAEIADCKEG